MWKKGDTNWVATGYGEDQTQEYKNWLSKETTTEEALTVLIQQQLNQFAIQKNEDITSFFKKNIKLDSFSINEATIDFNNLTIQELKNTKQYQIKIPYSLKQQIKLSSKEWKEQQVFHVIHSRPNVPHSENWIDTGAKQTTYTYFQNSSFIVYINQNDFKNGKEDYQKSVLSKIKDNSIKSIFQNKTYNTPLQTTLYQYIRKVQNDEALPEETKKQPENYIDKYTWKYFKELFNFNLNNEWIEETYSDITDNSDSNIWDVIDHIEIGYIYFDANFSGTFDLIFFDKNQQKTNTVSDIPFKYAGEKFEQNDQQKQQLANDLANNFLGELNLSKPNINNKNFNLDKYLSFLNQTYSNIYMNDISSIFDNLQFDIQPTSFNNQKGKVMFEYQDVYIILSDFSIDGYTKTNIDEYKTIYSINLNYYIDVNFIPEFTSNLFLDRQKWLITGNTNLGTFPISDRKQTGLFNITVTTTPDIKNIIGFELNQENYKQYLKFESDYISQLEQSLVFDYSQNTNIVCNIPQLSKYNLTLDFNSLFKPQEQYISDLQTELQTIINNVDFSNYQFDKLSASKLTNEILSKINTKLPNGIEIKLDLIQNNITENNYLKQKSNQKNNDIDIETLSDDIYTKKFNFSFDVSVINTNNEDKNSDNVFAKFNITKQDGYLFENKTLIDFEQSFEKETTNKKDSLTTDDFVLTKETLNNWLQHNNTKDFLTEIYNFNLDSFLFNNNYQATNIIQTKSQNKVGYDIEFRDKDNNQLISKKGFYINPNILKTNQEVLTEFITNKETLINSNPNDIYNAFLDGKYQNGVLEYNYKGNKIIANIDDTKKDNYQITYQINNQDTIIKNYSINSNNQTNSNKNQQQTDNWYIYVSIGIGILSILLIGSLILYKKKHKHNLKKLAKKELKDTNNL